MHPDLSGLVHRSDAASHTQNHRRFSWSLTDARRPPQVRGLRIRRVIPCAASAHVLARLSMLNNHVVKHRVEVIRRADGRIEWIRRAPLVASRRPGANSRSDAIEVTERARSGFVGGSAVSALGNSMAWLAVTFLIYDQTSSVAVTSLVTLCSAAPSLLLAGRATMLLGRFGAVRVFFACGVLLALLGLVPTILSFTGRLGTWNLLVWCLLVGAVVGLSGGAGSMVTRHVAPAGRLPEYNARIVRAKALASIAGLLAGGALLTLMGPSWLLLLNALTYLAPLIPLIGMRVASGKPAPYVSLRQAWAIRRQFPGLRAVFLSTITASVVGSFSIAMPALGKLVSPQPWAYSGVQTAYVAGGVVAAGLIAAVKGHVAWGTAARWATVVAGVGLLLLAWATRLIGLPALLFGVACILLLLIGSARSMRSTILVASEQYGAPESARAAYLTLFRLPPLAIVPISQLLLGILVDVTSLAVAFSMCGFLSLVAVVIGRRMKVARDINEMYELPASVTL